MKNCYNKIVKMLVTGIVLLSFASCSDFLTKKPLTSFTDEFYWTSEASIKNFAWSLYSSTLIAYGTGTSADFYWQSESNPMGLSEDMRAATFLAFPVIAYTTSSTWSGHYENIRRANLMLARIPEMDLSDAVKSHWMAVARFFRAHRYFSLVAAWGDVPLITEFLDPSEKDKMYVPRSSRKEVMNLIISDLQYACTNMNAAPVSIVNNNNNDNLHRDVAYAFLARVALYEGTFRKYHNLGDYNGYLQMAESAAKTLIDKPYYGLQSNSYKTKYMSENLAGNKEVIFFKRYVRDVLCHYIQAHIHSSSPQSFGLTKYAVESYVCKDGLPISQSPLYQGDHGIANVRANRDPRLLDATFDLLAFSGNNYPNSKVNSTTGFAPAMFTDFSKSLTDPEVESENRNHTDGPLFTICEAYLIYAEAKAELGTITQNDLDISVNLLRRRVGIPDLTLMGSDVTVNGVIINDPKRTSDLERATKGGVVSPLLWEIRRERRAEFMAWRLLRHADLDRWAKGEYLDSRLNPDVMKGAWIEGVPAGSNVATDNPTNNKGPGYIFLSSIRTFNEKYYLDPVPTTEITLYESKGAKLTQNPGW